MDDHTRRRIGTGLAVAAGAGLLALSGLAGLGDLEFGFWVRLLSFGGAGLGLLVVLAAWALRRSSPGRFFLIAVFAVGVAARVFLFGAPHELSEDAARYHWDGKVLASGVNPYLHPPNAPELDHIERHVLDEDMSEMSKRTLTVYPPLAEMVFAAGYVASPGGYLGLRLLWLLAEVAAWLLLSRALSRWRRSQCWLLLAAWNPIRIGAGYLAGHVDIVMLPFVVLFLSAVPDRRPLRAGAFLALACLIKPWPLLLLPAAWLELGTRRTLALGAVLAGVVAAFYLPFLGAGGKLFDSMWLMARQWNFNGSVSQLAEQLFEMKTAHLLCGGLMAVAVLAGLRIGRDFLSRCLLAAAAFAIFMPTLFPWYLYWVVPVLVLRPDPALIAFGVLLPLTDLVLIDYFLEGVWLQPVWTLWVEYGVFYALLLVGARKRWGMFG